MFDVWEIIAFILSGAIPSLIISLVIRKKTGIAYAGKEMEVWFREGLIQGCLGAVLLMIPTASVALLGIGGARYWPGGPFYPDVMMLYLLMVVIPCCAIGILIRARLAQRKIDTFLVPLWIFFGGVVGWIYLSIFAPFLVLMSWGGL